jgi:hypothetical protein
MVSLLCVFAGELALAAPARAEATSPHDVRARVGVEPPAADGRTLRRAEVNCFDPFRPRRRPDGTCCPPPPKWEPREDPCAPLDRCEIDWCESPVHLTLGLGLNFSEGNSEKFDLVFTGEAAYDRWPWLVRLRWLLAYGETSGAATTDALHWDLRGEREINRKFAAFVALGFDGDKIAGLQHRWIGTVGIAYWLFRRKGTFLKTELGGGMTIERRRFLAETTDPSGYAGAEYLRRFRNHVDLGVLARFYPNFGDFDLSLLVVEANLKVPITQGCSLVLRGRVDHVFQAPAPAENTDVIVSVGVQVTL